MKIAKSTVITCSQAHSVNHVFTTHIARTEPIPLKIKSKAVNEINSAEFYFMYKEKNLALESEVHADLVR